MHTPPPPSLLPPPAPPLIPPSNPPSPQAGGGQDPADGAPGDLRTNLSAAINLAIEAKDIAEQEKEKLNSLLDWFFETRNLFEADNVEEDPEQIMKEVRPPASLHPP